MCRNVVGRLPSKFILLSQDLQVNSGKTGQCIFFICFEGGVAMETLQLLAILCLCLLLVGLSKYYKKSA